MWMVGAVSGLDNRECALIQRPGLKKLPQIKKQTGEIVEPVGDSRVVNAVYGFVNAQRPLIQRPGLIESP